MAVDTPQVQRGIAKWTFLTTFIIGVVTYLLGAKQFSFGLVFGVVLSVINYRVISVILDVAFRTASADLARVISFASYHVRFWLIVIILYIVIPRTHYLFGVGTFAGILLPKMIMGVYVVKSTDEEWWARPKETDAQPDEEIHKPVMKKKDEPDMIRFPGLDFDDRYKNDPRYDDKG
ncbi:MAG: hypothetical protein CVU89_06065 [Firmicutes bacterium HGW-Firmicutes-14]|nr:MAG: hypothetical protein CVU89_06065 [Firmicutes bacterium HGW-Firmicutes-14]